MIIVKTPVTTPMARRDRPQPGAGALVTANDLGFGFSGKGGGATFDHPFRPALSGKNINFKIGLVRSLNGVGPIQPTIKVGGQQVPMSGKNGNTRTPLVLDPGMQNADGVSWAVLEVSPDPTSGELIQGALCQLVHGVTTTSTDPNLGRTPIAMILWRKQVPVQALPCVNFNLLYERVLPKAGNGAPKHFFI
jgi:hypothetical protein